MQISYPCNESKRNRSQHYLDNTEQCLGTQNFTFELTLTTWRSH